MPCSISKRDDSSTHDPRSRHAKPLVWSHVHRVDSSNVQTPIVHVNKVAVGRHPALVRDDSAGRGKVELHLNVWQR
jgi:hypothetical protein